MGYVILSSKQEGGMQDGWSRSFMGSGRRDAVLPDSPFRRADLDAETVLPFREALFYRDGRIRRVPALHPDPPAPGCAPADRMVPANGTNPLAVQPVPRAYRRHF